MAFAAVSEELNCSICLNVYSDPVMLSCGHNFCRACIANVLDTQHSSGVYSCPQCRTEFKERPALQRNIALRNIAEHFLSAPPQHDPSGILCTYCINAAVPAIKTCVNCEASLCVGHIKVHNQFKEHILIEPTACLADRKCNIHKKILEYYCSEDSVCICLACIMDSTHNGHKVVSIDEAFENKRRTLSNDFEVLLQKRAEVEIQVQSLLDQKNNVKGHASDLKEKVVNMFLELQKDLDTLKETVLAEISRQETEVSNSVADLIQQLKITLDELSKGIIKTEKLRMTTDPFSFLRDQEADRGKCAASKEGNLKNLPIKSHEDSEDSRVGDIDEGLILITLMEGLSHFVSQLKVENEDLLLDVDTAGDKLSISKDLKMVSWTTISNRYPEIPKRFKNNQVLTRASISSGCHFWQVETGEMGNFRFGIVYSTIERKKDPLIGCNKKSWCLRRFNDKYSILHDKKEILLPYTTTSKNVGVYLDYEAGWMSFYELGDTIRHLHTFTTTFTEPLHAAFLVWESFIKIKGATKSMVKLL
ncbi:E3 ubiquitin/ISG15 ligase TRIM25-like [Gastrophryne carolinensis]